MKSIWGRRGRQYYWTRVDNFSELAAWIRLQSIDVDYIDKHRWNYYTLETQIRLHVILGSDTYTYITCAEPYTSGATVGNREWRKLHEFRLVMARMV
jgi:hypothetical protein